MNIGYHIPFEGFNNTLQTAVSLGLPTFQMFIRNNRNLKMRDFSQFDYDMFNRNLPSSGISSYVVHASYAINPASGETDKRKRAVEIIKKDLMILSNLSGYKYYVLHPGCSTYFDRNECLSNLVTTLYEIAPYTKGTKVCVETMAGEGTELISSKEDILMLCYLCNELEDFALCLDTCHLFGAGINFDELIRLLTHADAIDKIGVIHCNGSKQPFGSRRDNHGSLRSGYLPLEKNVEALNLIRCISSDIPIILESESSAMLEDWLAIRKAVLF